MVLNLLPFFLGIAQVYYWQEQHILLQIGTLISLYQQRLKNVHTFFLSALLFISGGLLYKAYNRRLFSTVAHITYALKNKKACVIQAATMPVMITKNKFKYRMRIISCGNYQARVPIYTTVFSRQIDCSIGDLFYLSTENSQIIDPSIIYRLNPKRLRSHRNLFSLSIRKTQDLQKIQAITAEKNPLIWLRAHTIRGYSLGQGHPITTALSLALLFGEQSQIPQDIWRLFKNTGTAHLIAISGLHMTLIGQIICRCLQFFLCRIITINPLFYSEHLANCFLILYAILSGLPPSCIRAVGMATLRTTLKFNYFRTSSLNITLTILFAHCIILPEHIASVGFQLSYGMVISLQVVDRVIPNRWLTLKKWLSIPCVSSLWSLFYWKTLIIVGPLANAIAVPWISTMILPVTIMSCLISTINMFIAQKIQMIVTINWSLLLYILRQCDHWIPTVSIWG